jgi:cytochrome c oxidase cbb3-type subunit 3
MNRAALALVVMTSAIALPSMGCRKSASAGAPQEGRALFASTCARCHGENGTGGLPLWDGGPQPRNFCEHGFHTSMTDDQIRQTIVSGKGMGMPAFGAVFTPAQLDALVAHVRQFDPK